MKFKATVDVDALLAGLDEDARHLEESARPAAQAGAQVLYDAVKARVGQLGKVTGNLDSSIYQAFKDRLSGPGHAVYDVSWNARKAPHGHLLEDGWIQRYAVHLGKDGKWYTLVRADQRGKPKPSRRAPQAVKDAYYVLRPGGPVQHPAKAFVRGAVQNIPAAQEAMEQRLFLEWDKR